MKPRDVVRKKPFGYQETDAQHFAKRRSGLIAHQPRVGKTGISIRAADLLGPAGPDDLIVIICPANVRPNWITAIWEFRRKGWTAIVCSWNKAAELQRKLRGRKIKVLVIDESHFAKERSSARTKAVYGTLCDGQEGLCELAEHVYCLTGTPLPNNPTELWPMLRAIAPELIDNGRGKPLSFSAFRDRYCKMQQTPFGMRIAGAKNYKELKSKLMDTGFCRRRTRQEVFGRDIQPPDTIQVSASANFKTELKSLENSPEGKKISEALDRGGLKALAKLEGAAQMRQLFGLAKVESLSSLIADELDMEPDKKIVVGCFHTKVIDAYSMALRKYNPLVFDGRADGPRKKRMNDQFLLQPKYRVIIAQIQAAGVGLDFSSANDTIFAEWAWVGTDNEQIMARMFNVASPFPKFTRFAMLPNSFDSRIASEASRKLKDQAKIFG